MNRKRTETALRLQRQTLRTLAITELANVAGGRAGSGGCGGSKDDGNARCTVPPETHGC